MSGSYKTYKLGESPNSSPKIQVSRNSSKFVSDVTINGETVAKFYVFNHVKRATKLAEMLVKEIAKSL